MSEGPVQGCGQFWGNFILASPGATDCFGCGKRIGSYDSCEQAASESGKENWGELMDIGDLIGKENWGGPHVRAATSRMESNSGNSTHLHLKIRREGYNMIYDRTGTMSSMTEPTAAGAAATDPEPGHTPVCFCELNGDRTACLVNEGDMEETCRHGEELAGWCGLFFAWMAWAIISTIVYSVAACKAAKVPSSVQDQGGNQIHLAVPHATAQPAVLTTHCGRPAAQPVAQVPMPTVVVQPTAEVPIGIVIPMSA